MKLHKTAAVSVLAIAALGVATGTAHADPAAPDQPPAVQYVDARQDAYDNMVRQIEQGWFNGGAMNAQIGAGVGAAVGCVLFLFVGCLPGAAIGGAIGAATGIGNANPAVQPAIFDFVETLY